MVEVTKKLEEIEKYNIETRALIDDNTEKIDKLIENQENTNKSIAGLVTAWNTAGSVAKFIRWCAAIGTALYFFLDVIKGKT